MFAKLFARITESSLMEQPIHARYVFMGLLAIADAKGHVIGTDIALARRLNIESADFQDAVTRLSSPDPDSNSPEEEGKRLVPSECGRGYRIVNYLAYRNIRDEADRREYMRGYMQDYRATGKDKSRPVNSVNSVNSCKRRLAKAEEEAEEEAEATLSLSAEPIGVVEEAIYELYPRKVAKPAALRAIRKALRTYPPETLRERTKSYAAAVQGQDPQFIPYPATWFGQERFNDDPQTWARNDKTTASKEPKPTTLTTSIDPADL